MVLNDTRSGARKEASWQQLTPESPPTSPSFPKEATVRSPLWATFPEDDPQQESVLRSVPLWQLPSQGGRWGWEGGT